MPDSHLIVELIPMEYRPCPGNYYFLAFLWNALPSAVSSSFDHRSVGILCNTTLFSIISSLKCSTSLTGIPFFVIFFFFFFRKIFLVRFEFPVLPTKSHLREFFSLRLVWNISVYASRSVAAVFIARLHTPHISVDDKSSIRFICALQWSWAFLDIVGSFNKPILYFGSLSLSFCFLCIWCSCS